MAHIILTGATGTAGSAILCYCLSSSAISKISILSRRPVKLAEGHDKAKVIIHKDYNNYPDELLQKLQGAKGCIWAQGKTSMGMNESDYTLLTHDYPLSAARAFSSLSPSASIPFNFVYVSGEGADPTDSSRQCRPALKVYNVRPAMIDPGNNYLGDRPRSMAEKVWDFSAPMMRRLLPSGLVSPTDKLAEVLVQLAIGDGEPIPDGEGVENGRTLRNTALRRLGGI